MRFDMMAFAFLALAADPAVTTPPADRWGGHGHEISARVAVRTLPAEMPAFFRAAENQLAWLLPEPDRWRDSEETRADPAMTNAAAPDHWVHMDEVPRELLELDDRFDYIVALDRAGLSPDDVGILPFTLLELTQRLRSTFRRWRTEDDPAVRLWLEHRILDDAGLLGHYVTDAANPHHTSMHHTGWVGDNPRFDVQPSFHSRFESQFVGARVTLDELLAAMRPDVRVLPDFREAIVAHLDETHAQLVRLYELDTRRAFDRDNDSPEHEAFAIERLAAGASMLRDVWWTAWVTSAPREQDRLQ